MRPTCYLAPFLALAASCASADSPRVLAPVEGGPTEHTRALDPGTSATGTVQDCAFLTGRWLGEAFGGQIEESWTPPLAGQMLGTFRLVQDGAPAFSEHMLIAEQKGRIVLRLKHFNADLTGWETKEEFVDFPLVAAETEDGVAWFDGLTFARDGDHLTIYLAMKTADGAREEVMHLRRADR